MILRDRNNDILGIQSDAPLSYIMSLTDHPHNLSGSRRIRSEKG